MSLFIATCGPTGVGKTYQMARLMGREPARFTAVRSVTTRPSRGPEDDAWYRFVTREEIAKIDSTDILSDAEFRGERYLWLRSELNNAAVRAPIAFMAVIPSIIMRFRTANIPHLLLNCRIGDVAIYEERLRRRGYQEEKLAKELAEGKNFVYPPTDPLWPEGDVLLGSDSEDAARFDAALHTLISPYV